MSKVISTLLAIFVLPAVLLGILSVYSILAVFVMMAMVFVVLIIVLFGVLWAAGVPLTVKYQGKDYGRLQWFKFSRPAK